MWLEAFEFLDIDAVTPPVAGIFEQYFDAGAGEICLDIGCTLTAAGRVSAFFPAPEVLDVHRVWSNCGEGVIFIRGNRGSPFRC